MMLAAVEAVTEADAVRESRSRDSDVPAQTTAGEFGGRLSSVWRVRSHAAGG